MLTLLTMALVDPAFAASKFKNPDDKRKWHEVSWGTSPGEDMNCNAGAFDDLKVCTRPAASGDRAIGPLTADSVTYHYYLDRLYRVEIVIGNEDAATQVSTGLRLLYGESLWDARDMKEAWKGTQVQIGFLRSAKKQGATLIYQYLPLLLDVDVARGRAAGEAFKEMSAEL